MQLWDAEMFSAVEHSSVEDREALNEIDFRAIWQKEAKKVGYVLAGRRVLVNATILFVIYIPARATIMRYLTHLLPVIASGRADSLADAYFMNSHFHVV